ncbi:MAG: TIGR01459 family HAD-type hydrolase [Inquilinaceae bacterium]
MTGRPMPAPTTLPALADRFDVFLVDQFGVLHDGIAPYDGAVEALRALKAAGKRIVILSNSGKRSAPNSARLVSLGFAADSFDLFLTSGEVAWSMLADSMIGRSIPRGARCLLLARDDDSSAIDGLDLARATDADAADIVMISGSRGEVVTLDEYRRQLEPAARRQVPCLCTNPDKIMLTNAGSGFGAGAIADLYAGMGGPVTWIGKPYPAIYRAALAAMGDPDRARVCCIGDSVEHDIAGGRNAGLSTALVRSGILADAGAAELARLFEEHAAVPDHIVAAFSWDEGNAGS